MPATGVAHREPNRHDVEEDTYALCVNGQRQTLWRFSESPVRPMKRWQQVDRYDDESAPKVTLEGATIISDENGNVWIYAENVEADKDAQSWDETADLNSYADEELEKYIIYFSDGKTVDADSQVDTMEETVRHLINAHRLLDQVDLPYTPGSKNALLNDRPLHPDGREMSRSRKVADGAYIETSMDRERKKNQLSKLVSRCYDVDIDFAGGWLS